MTTTYTWNFRRLEHEDRSGLTYVVTCIHYRCVGTDGIHSAEYPGTQACDDPGESFTAWANLTPEIVKGWLPAETITAAEAAVQAEIDRKAAEAAKNKGAGVPWLSSAT